MKKTLTALTLILCLLLCTLTACGQKAAESDDHVATETVLDATGKVQSTTEYAYDAAGHVIHTMVYQETDEKNWLLTHTSDTYREDGTRDTMTAWAMASVDGVVNKTDVKSAAYTYLADGAEQLVQEGQTDTRWYGENGELLRWLNAVGDSSMDTTYTYNRHGDVEQIDHSYVFANGATSSSQQKFEYEYKSSQKVKQTCTASDAKDLHPGDYTEYTRDDAGNIILEAHYTADGTCTGSTEYTYVPKNETNGSIPEMTDFYALSNGIWVDESSCENTWFSGVGFWFLEIQDGKLTFGIYPGDYGRTGTVTDVFDMGDNRYMLTLYYPAGEVEGDYEEEAVTRSIVCIDGDTLTFPYESTVEYTRMGTDLDTVKQLLNEKHGFASWSEAYGMLLDDYRKQNPDEYEFCDYTLYDMDADGTPELFVKDGTCEADFMMDLYTFRPESDQPLVQLGRFPACHSAVCGYDEKGTFLLWMGHMGYEQISKATLDGDRLNWEVLFENTEDELADYHELAALPTYPWKDRTGLTWNGNREQHNRDVMETFVPTYLKDLPQDED